MYMSTRPNKGFFNKISNLSIYLGKVPDVSSLNESHKWLWDDDKIQSDQCENCF